MIAYFDTSAVVPLLVDEPGTRAAGALWDRADRLVSVRLTRVEARAALAQATRLNRISDKQHQTAKRELEDLLAQLDVVDIDDVLARRAGDLAEIHSLRGYDAVHLAGAERIADPDLVMVTGDRALCRAAEKMDMALAPLGETAE